MVAAVILLAAAAPVGAQQAGRDPGSAFCCATSRGGNTFFENPASAPFPCGAACDEPGRPFFDSVDPASGTPVHTATGGARYPEKGHYDSSLTVVHLPPAFDPGKPFTWVVWLHGRSTRVLLGARGLRLMDQVDESGENVVLVAPQLARDADDAAPGKLALPGGFDRFLREVSREVRRKKGWGDDPRFDAAPVVLVAHGTGSLAAARVLERGGAGERIRGVILLDAPYAGDPAFADWTAGRRGTLISLSTAGTAEAEARLRERLTAAGAVPRDNRPPSWEPGGAFFYRSAAEHDRLPLDGPPEPPLMRFLAGVNGPAALPPAAP
jgi:putative intracellular protease/amidase